MNADDLEPPQGPSGDPGNPSQLQVYDGLTVQWNPSPTKKRILAYLIDLSLISLTINALILALAALVVIFIWGLIVTKGMPAVNAIPQSTVFKWLVIGFLIVIMLVLGGIYHGYFIYYEYKKRTTPGKRIFGLKVVPLHSPKLTVGQVAMRDLFRYVDCLMIIPGLVCVLLTKLKQRLGDLAIGTMVTYSPVEERENDSLYLLGNDYHYFRELLSPMTIPPDVRSSFLAFAFPLLILNWASAPEELQSAWEKTLVTYLPGAAKANLDRKTVFSFFAEHCLRLSRGAN